MIINYLNFPSHLGHFQNYLFYFLYFEDKHFLKMNINQLSFFSKLSKFLILSDLKSTAPVPFTEK